MNYQNRFAVQQLRTKNLVKGIESLSGFVAAVVANMLIPQLLLKYIYDPTTLVAAPPVFEYLPLVTYGLALLYFVGAMFGNFKREQKARRIESELNLYSDECSGESCSDGSCCDEDEISDEELKELERIVDEALKPTKKKTKSKKKTVKKKAVKTKKTK